MNTPVLTRRAFVRDVSALGVSSLLSVASAKALGQNATSGAPTGSAAEDKVGSTQLHKLTPVPIRRVVIDDEFWSPKRKVWQEVTIRDCFAKFESDRGGAINNFDKVRDGQTGGHAGDPWMDGLVYEMIRGASDFLLSHPNPALEKQSTLYRRSPRRLRSTRMATSIRIRQFIEPGHESGLNGGLQIWQHEIYNSSPSSMREYITIAQLEDSLLVAV